ncbi:MAG: MFS transporter (Seo1) [Cirrosporium novae-zelandiae]|nr:MAG: MFS transporter (Seo1) [Cirrosporium novae-zelandiae]
MAKPTEAQRRWYHWYAPSDTLEERKLIVKLDLLIVPIAFTVYWVKYMDQANINNAYVSGMKEDLGFYGNELVHFQTIYVLGAVLGQIPCAYLLTTIPMQLLIPTMDLGWGTFNLLQFRANSYSEIMAYRFMVGLCESAYYPGVHYVLGSWYRADEIGRRGGLFFLGNTLGTLTASLIQSRASSHLDGVNGLAGWRWMFIITSIMTLPLGILGFFIWPGTPSKPRMLFLSPKDIRLAKSRLRINGAQDTTASTKWTWSLLKHVFSTWKIYMLTIWTIFSWQGNLNTSSGGFLLWLKSLNRYSVSEINNLNAISPGLGMLYVLFLSFGSDLFLGRMGAIVLGYSVQITSLLILSVWNVPEPAKWFAFMTTYFSSAVSVIQYGWANDICKHNIRERGFTLIVMNAVSQSTTAWTALLVFKTVEGPRFPKGKKYEQDALIISSEEPTPTAEHHHDQGNESQPPRPNITKTASINIIKEEKMSI